MTNPVAPLDGACDCHVHVIGPQDAYPMDPARPYTPGTASAQALRTHLDTLGLSRAVIVQPSVYGTDNRCLLDALHAMQGQARGIAVVSQDIDDAALAQLDAGGVTGLRLNLESLGQRDPRAIQTHLRHWSARLAGSGWHLQVYAAFDTLAAALDGLDPLSIPVVLDHFAMTPPDTPPGHTGLQRLLAGLASGQLYVKLSGAYRLPASSTQAVTALAQTFLAANPEQVLWASDWPHTNREPGKACTEVSAYRDIPARTLRQTLHDWLPDAARRQQVLVDNPARLYRF